MTADNDKPRSFPVSVRLASRKRSAAHPRSSLKQAEEFARVIFQAGARGCNQDVIAKKAGFSSANNGSFFTVRATAQQFGMVVSDARSISVSEDWIKVFLHDDRQQLLLARQKAMYQPDLYKQLIEEFANRMLPTVEKLAQQLYINPKYGILKDAAGVAAKVFYDSASYAGILNDRNYIQPVDNATIVAARTEQPAEAEPEAEAEVIQEPVRDTITERLWQGKDRNSLLTSPPPSSLVDQVKIDIHLENDQIMHIEGPRRLLRTDKERIKQYIELWLEERAGSNTPNLTNDASNIDN